MTDDDRRRDDEAGLQLALFRYGVIAPLVEREELGRGEVSELVRELADQTHYLPGRGPVHVAERTVYEWRRRYLRGGIEVLLPKVRKDKGARRALSDEVLARAIRLRKEDPRRWTSTLIDIMGREGTLEGEPSFHRATLDRHLDRRGASRRRLRVLGSRRTIKMRRDRFGDLWVGDYHHGPLALLPGGRTAPAKLGAIIDHCTRGVVSDRYYPAEDIASMRDCLFRALLTWGAPRVFYADRGAVYRARQLAYALHDINCRLVHSRAYYSQGRGVIERWWQLAEAFENEVEGLGRLLTLHELNRLWEAFREERYSRVIHSELGRTPAEALTQVTPSPIDPLLARHLFLVRDKRTVNKKDGCVSVLTHRFLCEPFLRGREVQVRFDPRDLASVEVYLDGERVQTAFPQLLNAPPDPHVEPERLERSVDYLSLIRRDYDQRLLEHARPLAYADLAVEEAFDLDSFVQVVADLAGLKLRPSAREELAELWHSFGPLPEDLVRIGTEHAVRLHGRGRHVRVYMHAIRTLVLAHWRSPGNNHKEDR